MAGEAVVVAVPVVAAVVAGFVGDSAEAVSNSASDVAIVVMNDEHQFKDW